MYRHSRTHFLVNCVATAFLLALGIALRYAYNEPVGSLFILVALIYGLVLSATYLALKMRGKSLTQVQTELRAAVDRERR